MVVSFCFFDIYYVAPMLFKQCLIQVKTELDIAFTISIQQKVSNQSRPETFIMWFSVNQYSACIMPRLELLINFTILVISSLCGICSLIFITASSTLVSPLNTRR